MRKQVMALLLGGSLVACSAPPRALTVSEDLPEVVIKVAKEPRPPEKKELPPELQEAFIRSCSAYWGPDWIMVQYCVKNRSDEYLYLYGDTLPNPT